MATALRNETPEQRAARKEQIKAQKADKRARREGHVPDEYGQKQCSLCDQLKDLLIRCQIDKTEKWHMVCGKCWKKVSGGVVDGDDDHPDYRLTFRTANDMQLEQRCIEVLRDAKKDNTGS
ncbi:hypothetical protein WJX79_010383 [Trebouxia sp. C0005]